MNSRKAWTIGTVGFFGSFLLGASLAWACTAQPYIQISPKSGEPGTVVEINGNGFGNGGVEIRWGSQNGEKIGQTNGPSFSVPVTIPNASPGVYYVLAISQTLTGQQGNVVARDSFEVTPATARSQPSQTTSSGSNNTGSAGNNSGGDARPPSSSPQQTAPEAPQPGPAQRPSLESTTTDAGSLARPVNQDAGGPPRGGPDGGAPAQGPSGPPQAPDGGAESVQAVDPVPVELPRSLARTVSPDLWSGFERATRSPGLLETAEEPASRQQDLYIGISVLGAALLTVLGGLVVLEGRRRRELAGTRLPG